jgi:signal transduction histidine kinase
VKPPWRWRGAGATRQASLVGRLVLLAAAWSLAVIILAGFGLSVVFSRAAMARFDNGLSQALDGLVAGASLENGQVMPPTFTDPRTLRAYSGAYWEIAVAQGQAQGQGQGQGVTAAARSRSLWDHALTPPSDVLAALAKDPGQVTYFDAPGPLRQHLRVAAMQGRLPDLAVPLIFMTAEDRAPVDTAVRTFATAIAVSLAVLGGGLIAAVIVQVRVGLQPLFALRREVAAVRTGERERIEGAYPTELQPLAAELNALMAHTQEVVERQRTHVGNLAHALKTPLSVIQTEARQQPGPLADLVLRQAASMGEHVDHHLRRARAAARAQSPGERTAVAPVVEELARTLEKIFQEKVSEIEWLCPEDLQFNGERQDLLEIAGNLMENACKWCRTFVRVSAAAAGPRRLTLIVEDDGPGLDPDQRTQVLRRGARLDEATPGSGLGLSIVDELVRAYGGATTLSASDLGGLKLLIELPRADG